jgi:hypothetical protein
LKNIALYIRHGVEVRYFLLSGLADQLKKENNVYLVCDDITSENFKGYLNIYNFKILNIPKFEPNKITYEKYVRSFTNARKRVKNKETYSHFGSINKEPKWFDWIFKFDLINKAIEKIIINLFESSYQNKLVKSFLIENKIDKIYYLEYNDSKIKTIANTANNIGIENFILINTLKTIFINDFITFKISKLFSWNEQQNKLFIEANTNKKINVFVSKGSPYHCFLRTVDLDNQNKVKIKYNLPKNRKIILYSLINEKVYENEYLIIEKINNLINECFEVEKPLLLIRRNPFEENTEILEKLKHLNNVVVMDHFWERNAEKEWTLQSYQGELEWRAILQIASLSMNIPSMATIDSLMCGTPVLNIGFDENGGVNNKLNHIIFSPFNLEFEKSEFVSTVYDFNTFEFKIIDSLKFKNLNNIGTIQNSISISKSEISSFTS